MHIKVRVATQSKKNVVTRLNENSFSVYTKAKPERGEANLAVHKLLCEFLSIAPQKLRLIKGPRSPSKIFEMK